ncbi:hypothetical protein EVAR_94116_1 [Eumeta japonica]|uniref:Uncharacterized protein n=1 Tax=Eumeta variegata TaxID=151549 RepID=A0A4C1U7K1_EUMVA|nr:hypothetical protein EVAR_94116_1 [Eumeta japonica]
MYLYQRFDSRISDGITQKYGTICGGASESNQRTSRCRMASEWRRRSSVGRDTDARASRFDRAISGGREFVHTTAASSLRIPFDYLSRTSPLP